MFDSMSGQQKKKTTCGKKGDTVKITKYFQSFLMLEEIF